MLWRLSNPGLVLKRLPYWTYRTLNWAFPEEGWRLFSMYMNPIAYCAFRMRTLSIPDKDITHHWSKSEMTLTVEGSVYI